MRIVPVSPAGVCGIPTLLGSVEKWTTSLEALSPFRIYLKPIKPTSKMDWSREISGLGRDDIGVNTHKLLLDRFAFALGRSEDVKSFMVCGSICARQVAMKMLRPCVEWLHRM